MTDTLVNIAFTMGGFICGFAICLLLTTVDPMVQQPASPKQDQSDAAKRLRELDAAYRGRRLNAMLDEPVGSRIDERG